MEDTLAERRARKQKLKAQYLSGIDGLMEQVRASWRKEWVKDCREKGRTIPFGEWCFQPLDPEDPDSSPFEIANVYE